MKMFWMGLSKQYIGKEKQTFTDALLELTKIERPWDAEGQLGWAKIKGKDFVLTLTEYVVESREDKETMRLRSWIEQLTTLDGCTRPEEKNGKGRWDCT